MYLEMKNFTDSYSKKLMKSKSSKSITNVKLPKLFQNHSLQELVIRKIEKLKAYIIRNRNNPGEKKVKAKLSSLFNIRKINNDNISQIIKFENDQNKLNYKNKNNRSFSLSSYHSNYKTIFSNSGNNYNYIHFSNNIINNNINNNNDSNNDRTFNNIYDNCINYNINKNNCTNNKDINNNIIFDNKKGFIVDTSYNIDIKEKNNQNNNIENLDNNDGIFIKNNNNIYNKIKMIKIKYMNDKYSEEEKNKINSENSLFKRKFNNKVKKLNKDIFNLIDNKRNFIFFSKIKKQ